MLRSDLPCMPEGITISILPPTPPINIKLPVKDQSSFLPSSFFAVHGSVPKEKTPVYNHREWVLGPAMLVELLHSVVGLANMKLAVAAV